MKTSLFASEMRLLHEEAQYFAEAYPEHASKLNLKSLKDRDPYVERLLEGMAFLSAHVKARIDADIPEIAQTYMQHLCPTLLQMLPSALIAQMNADENTDRAPVWISKGTAFASQPIGPDKIECGFRTTTDFNYLPLSIIKVEHREKKVSEGGGSVLTLGFQWMSDVSLEKLSLDEIPVYIHADAEISFLLYQWLLSSVNTLSLNQNILGGQDMVQTCYLSTQETLLPSAKRGLDAFHLWLDYFACKDKYLFFKISGLKTINWVTTVVEHRFSFEIDFKRLMPDLIEIKKHYFLLNCLPLVNLYKHQAEPLCISQAKFEYTVVPDVSLSEGIQIQTIDAVKSVLNHEKQFHYKAVYDADAKPDEKTFSVYKNIQTNGFSKYVISFCGNISYEGERISCSITANNGYYPREYIMENQLKGISMEISKTLMVTNVTRPTAVWMCPFEKEALWLCISYLAMNVETFSDVEALKKCLSLFDWTDREENLKRREAIQAVKLKPVQYIKKGAYCRGIEYHITLNDKGFLNEGDQFLFGMVLHRFLSFFVGINYTVKTIVHRYPSHKSICFDPIYGTQCAL